MEGKRADFKINYSGFYSFVKSESILSTSAAGLRTLITWEQEDKGGKRKQ